MAVMFSVRSRTFLDVIKNSAYNIISKGRKLCINSASVNTSDGSHNELTSEEKSTQILLQHFNTASPEEIARFHAISIQRAMDIVAHREETGKFQVISDLTNVCNIGSKTVAKVMEEYRNNGYHLPEPEDDFEAKYKLTRRSIYPAFFSSELPESAVAFCVQIDAIYWAKMTRDLCVTDWSYKELGKYMHRKYDHATHLINLWKALQAIPLGSLYLMEDVFFAPSTRAITSATLNLARLESMLMLALNLRHHEYSTLSQKPPEQKVHRLKTSELARHFGLLVGNEKVSSQGVAMDIIKGKRTGSEVFISQQQCSEFMDSKRTVKEQLSNCLLQVTMFYELLLEQERNLSDLKDYPIDSTSEFY